MHRHIGRYRRSKYMKSMTSLIMTRHLLYAYFRLQKAQCLCKRVRGIGLELVLELVVAYRP